MKRNCIAALCAIFVLPVCVAILAQGQESQDAKRGITYVTGAGAEIPQPPSRVVEAVDDSKLVVLPGNTYPLARPQYDQGAVDPQLLLERMQMVLKRSPEQEAALVKYIDEEYDPKSPNFHNWLTPERFGKLYGPSDADIAKITSWLENHGFQIYQVTKGRTHIEFTGTAAQVQQAFHTEIHNYLVHGERHIANNTDPSIPRALAPVITGIASLHNFFPKPQFRLGRYVKMNHKTGKITPVDGSKETLPNGVKPQFGFTDENGNTEEDITPFDFATIYNLARLWNAGITGKGVNIAISAVTDINQSDIDTFRSDFGLPAMTVQVIHNGADPGMVAGSLVENTLDTEWSGAAAPDAQVVLVVSKSTATTFGGYLSDSDIVDTTPLIASTMSASYGECEIGLGTAGNSSVNLIYQQGTAAGISMFESAGDQGSTGCDNSDAPAPNPAQYGLQVNGDASSPYITGVGGTDFAWQIFSDQSDFWAASNSANGSNAVGYIPEIPWNGTCASNFLQDFLFSQDVAADTTTEASCNDTTNWGDFLLVTGGSGGKSSCITSTNGEFSTCGGGYPKPSWQKGTGVPADGVRDVPDVSLFASSGYPDGVAGSAYLICVASESPEKSCTKDYENPDDIVYQEVGGTSVSSPAMAGIMALVVQKVGSNQGLANSVLYQLFAKETLSSCDSFTVGNGSACVFYDINSLTDNNVVDVWTNAQPCKAGSMDCDTANQSDAYGIVSGYNTTKGYDYATGLGSVNAYNLAEAWPKTNTTKPTATLTPATLAFPSTKVGSTSATMVATLKNTGTTALQIPANGITISSPNSGSDYLSFPPTGTTCPVSPTVTTTLAAGASCTVTIAFEPAITGALTAILAVADNAANSPQTIALTGTGLPKTTGSGSVTLTPASIAFPKTPSGTESEATAVTVKNTGSAAVTIHSISIAGTNPTSFVQANTCPASLAASAACTVFVAFKPASAAALKGTLSVSDSGTGSPQTATLTGTGTAKPSVTLSTTSLTFTSTAEGVESEAKTVTVTNKGTSTLDITGISITGTNASSFLQLNTCGPTLAAGANCVIDVAFKPAAIGSLKASLVIADNGSTASQTVALAGTGAL